MMSELPELPEPNADWTYTADQMRSFARQAVAAERDLAAKVCDDLAAMMEDGAGEAEPGGRLRQAARYIREGHRTCGYDAARNIGEPL